MSESVIDTGTDTGTDGADVRASGPWDSTEAGADDGMERLDLGSLRLPGVEGMDIQLEVAQDSGEVVSAVMVLGSSALQVQAFAAPRSGGLWQEMRTAITESIRSQGGWVEEHEGSVGYELHAEVPAQDADGRPAKQRIRIAGIEGPRWVLHVIVNGAAVNDPDAAAFAERLIRGIVVVRGSDPMARGELLPMRIPAEMVQEGAEAPPQAAPDNPYAGGLQISGRG